MTVIRLKKEYFELSLICTCFYFIFRFPDEVKTGVIDSLTVCFYTIIPSLFPFMVLCAYISGSNLFKSRKIPPFIPIFLLSMIGGFPIGLKMISDGALRGNLTKKSTQKLSLFCMNGGPAFIITAVGANLLKSVKAGVIIYASVVISSLIMGLILSFFKIEDDKKINIQNDSDSPFHGISSSVNNALHSILSICAWVVFFGGITSCLKGLRLNDQWLTYISSFLEVTKGCIIFSKKINLPMIAAIIGFGGFCVHCQVLGYLKNIDMKYFYFFLSRVFCGVLSGIICHILLIFFPIPIDVFMNLGSITDTGFSVSLPSFFVFICMCIILIFDIDRKRKIC